MAKIRSRNFFDAYLMLAVFLCGGIVMLIEVLGTRVIAPFFGSSVFIWTATITVTLLALAFGYFLGGRAADRWPKPGVLYSAVLASGIYLLAVLFIKKPVLETCSILGLRMGALFSSALLFGPPLFLLGTVSPFAVKLYTHRIETVGSSVGMLYFISTVGSFLGTVLTGFVLIPQFGISDILINAAALLITISVVYFVIFSRDLKMLVFLIVPGAGLFMINQDALSTVVVGNDRWAEVYKTDSFYGRLKVVESNGINRYLLMDGANQGGASIEEGVSFAFYTYMLDILADMACPDMKDALVIGLGAGVIPNAFSKRGITVDAVDIDQKVVRIYDEFFSKYGARDRIHIFTEDGRYFIKRCPKRYDAVVLDVFLGDAAPWHLLTVEAFSGIKNILTDKGALVINFIGLPKERAGGQMLDAVGVTLSEVFPYSYTFNHSGIFGDTAQNVFFLASLKKPSFDFSVTPVVPGIFLENALKVMNDRKDGASVNAMILTDDHSPLEFYCAKVKEAWRRQIMRLRERDIMLD